MHTDWLHQQIWLAGVVEKAAHVTHGGWVHKCLGDGAGARVLPHRDDVVIVLGSLCELSASRLLETDHLSRVLAHKRAVRDGLQCPNSPAPVLRFKNLQPECEAPLHHAVTTGIAAAAKGVTFEHRRAVARVGAAEVDQCAAAAAAAVRLAACLQAGAALGGAGLEGAGASGQSDLTGVDGAAWSLDVIWGVLGRRGAGVNATSNYKAHNKNSEISVKLVKTAIML